MSFGKKVYTPKDIMEILDVSPNIAYGLLRSGELNSKKIGKLYRITEKSLNDYLDN